MELALILFAKRNNSAGKKKTVETQSNSWCEHGCQWMSSIFKPSLDTFRKNGTLDFVSQRHSQNSTHGTQETGEIDIEKVPFKDRITIEAMQKYLQRLGREILLLF